MSMENKRSSCLVDACKKFFKAITVGSPFGPIRRISNHHHQPQDSMPTNPSAASANSIPIVKTHHHTQKHPKPIAASEVVPIKFDYSPTQMNGKVASVAPNKNMQPISPFVQAKKIEAKHQADAAAAQEKRYQATSMENNNKMNANIEEDEFTKYIKRASNKIRTTSSVDGKSVGDGKKGKINASATGGEDTGNDNFSDYINRAKMRMLRTMSSFVGGRSDSMK